MSALFVEKHPGENQLLTSTWVALRDAFEQPKMFIGNKDLAQPEQRIRGTQREAKSAVRIFPADPAPCGAEG
jgi:hypothetical protein